MKREQVGSRKEENFEIGRRSGGRMAALENTGRGAGDRMTWKQVIIKGCRESDRY